MKRIFIFALAAITLTCCCNKERVVEFPEVSATNTTSIIIEKVELTDSVTKVQIRGYHYPKYWILITSDTHLVADGQTYEMTGTEGIIADEKLHMPADGDSLFTLKFAPIPLNTKSFDFIEGHGEGAFKLLDVNLTSKTDDAYKKGLPKDIKVTPDTVTEIHDFEYKIGETTLNIHLLGYKPEYGDKLEIYIEEFLGSDVKQKVQFDAATGTGTVHLTQYGSCRGFVRMYNIGLGTFYVSPGETVDIYCDLGYTDSISAKENRTNKPVRDVKSIYSKGSVFDTINNLPCPPLEIREFEFGYYQYVKNPDIHKLTAEEYIDKVQEDLNEVIEKIKHSSAHPVTKKLKIADMTLSAVCAADDCDMIREESYRRAHKIKWSDPIDYTYDTISNELKNKIFRFVDLSDNALMLSEYYSFIGAADEHFNKIWYATYQAIIDAKNCKLSSEQLAEMKKWDNPFYAQMCEDIYNKAVAMMAEGKGLIQPTPDVAVDKLFEAIIAPHQGKTILVDFWNSWCGPCRNAISYNEPFKKTELAGDNIVWIYLANETSPMTTYLEMIPDIEGLHFRLSQEQWKHLTDNVFDIDGIPSYVLVKKDGTYSLRNDLRDHNKMLKVLKAEKQL